MSTKILFVFIAFSLLAFKSLSGIYDITVQTLSGSSVSLNSYNGKKIVVVEFDPGDYDEAQLRMLDTLQRADTDLQVIAVPAKDFGGAVTTQAVQNIVTSLNLSFVVTQPAFVKKAAGSDQQDLFKWLTHVNENSHFDNDADDPGQIYLINKDGVLFAMLDKGTPNAVVKNVAEQ